MIAIEVASQITENLLSRVFRDGGRASWLQPARLPGPGNRELVAAKPVDGSLAAGTAGIALFLAEYARYASDNVARAVALEAIMHALDWADRSVSKGLYDGASGVAVAAGRIAALLDVPALRTRREIVCAPDTHGLSPENDLYSGLAGQALAALTLGDHPTATALSDGLLARALSSGDGVAWETGRTADRHAPLLGFAHGASGIAYALATIGRELGRDDYIAAAHAGCRYERAFFDSRWNNWPDLRSSAPPMPSSARQFLWAWCHGAPGIALSRLALATSHRDRLAELHDAVESTIAMTGRQLVADDADLCLCHGVCGNLDVVLTCGRDVRQREWEAWAAGGVASLSECRLADALEWSTGTGPSGDPSLMGGAAGVGFVALRCHNRFTPSVLAIDQAFIDIETSTATETTLESEYRHGAKAVR